MVFATHLRQLEIVSPAIRDTLRRHPEWIDWLQHRVESKQQDLAGIWSDWPQSEDRLSRLRQFKTFATIEIAFRDIAGFTSFEETVCRISGLAEMTIASALDAAWNDMAGKMTAPVKDRSGFAVIAMGKLGAAELNYASDVDLIFCRRASDDEQEMRFYTRLGERLVHILGHAGTDGFLYRVDMRLRPHGGTGPLVPTIDSLENYYESWGETWERQALIKSKPICGDPELALRFERFARKFVFARQMDDSSLEEIKQVKFRSEKEYARGADRFHVKQGPGGIRDIEFYVQYLQLIAGNSHEEVRTPATLDAIEALGRAKALLEGELSQLSLAYRFLRIIEHRLQLRSMTPQAMIPDHAAELKFLAGSLGFGSMDCGNADAFLATLRKWRTRIRSILERIYLTPGQLRPREREEEFAQLLSERTPKDRVREILAHYGFRDVDKAWQNIRLMALGPAGQPLPPGERRAFLEIVYPMLEVLGASLEPDRALHHLESFAAASGNRVSFVRALASRRPHLARLANLLALSNLSHQILTRHPEYFDSLARGIHLHEGRSSTEMLEELEARIEEAPEGRAELTLRRYRQREMIRVAYRDLAGLAGALEVSRELSDLAESCLIGSMKRISMSSDAMAPQSPMWIIALGKFGSRQMHYSSDLDLMFVYNDIDEHSSSETRTSLQLLQDKRVEGLLEMLSAVTAEGLAYKVDLRLRPEGGVGLLARSWSSFLDHARKYMQPWERMALIRSRLIDMNDPPAARAKVNGGDREQPLVGAGFSPHTQRWAEALDEIVYAYPWDQEALASIRHLKRRVESELNKESRIYLDFKFGAGGITDLEFLVQMLQLRFGRQHLSVRVPNTADALIALRDVGALAGDEAQELLDALQFQRRVENHYQLIEEWTSREISRESPVLERLARSLGYGNDARKSFLEDWDRTARRVRAIFERVVAQGW